MKIVNWEEKIKWTNMNNPVLRINGTKTVNSIYYIIDKHNSLSPNTYCICLIEPVDDRQFDHAQPQKWWKTIFYVVGPSALDENIQKKNLKGCLGHDFS